MPDIQFSLKLTADGDGLKGEVRASREEVEKLTGALGKSGTTGKKTATGFDKAARGAKNLKRESASASGKLKDLKHALFSVKAAVFSLAGGLLARDFSKTVTASEQLKASLKTMTGSIDGSAKAFALLEEFAAKTPYTLDQSVQGFIKLMALGLDPSEKAMMSYGNTAAAMGKDLSQMIEAVADASTGEFERLKEFGIKAKSEGDDVSFTFQGVTKTVGKNSQDIQAYLHEIGEVNFGGAMADQMSALPGLWSNLSDSVGGYWRELGDEGGTELLKSALTTAIGFVRSATDNISVAFSTMRLLAIGFVEGTLTGWEHIKFGFGASVAAIELAWFGTIEGLKIGFGEYIQFVSKGLSYVPGLGGLSESLAGYGSTLGDVKKPVAEFAATMDELNATHDDAVSSIKAVTASMAASEIQAHAAKKAKKALAGSLSDFADKSAKAKQKADKLAASQKALTDELYPLKVAQKAYNADLKTLHTLYPEATRGTAEYADALHRLGKLHPDLKITVDDDELKDFLDTGFESNAFEAFDELGRSMFGVGDALDNMAERQQIYNELLAEGGLTANELAQASAKNAQDQMSAYGDITGAAKGFFEEGSDGYKALEKAEKAFRAIEIAMSAKSLAAKLFGTTTSTAASVASGPVVIAVEMAKSAASAVAAAASSMAGLPFPLNLGALAATVAALAGIGALISGGSGGGSYAAPTASGGTVLGSDETSSSISNSFDFFEDIQLDQLAELRGIHSSLSGLNAGIEALAISFLRDVDFSDGGYTGQLGKTSNDFGLGSLSESFDLLGITSLASKLVGGLFGSTKKSLIDTGIAFLSQTLGEVFESGELEANVFTVIKTVKKKAFGLSRRTSYNTAYSPLDDDITQNIGDIFSHIGDVVGSSVELLGITSERALEDYVISIGNISFRGLDGDEIQEELEAVFSQQSDLIAEYLVPAIAEYQQIGEGSFETLQRVTVEQVTFNDHLERTGSELLGLSAIMEIDVAQAIIGMTGGLEEFTDAANKYFDAFFTDQEKLAQLELSLTDVFNDLEVPLARTRNGFRSIVQSLDITTAAGQATYAALIELSPALDEYYDSLEKQKEAIEDLTRSAIDLATELYGDGIIDQQRAAEELYKTEMRRYNDAIAAQARLSSYLDNLQTGNLSTLSPAEKLAEASENFTAALAAGDANAATTQASGYLSLARDFYASSGAYSDIFVSVNQQLSDMQNAFGAVQEPADFVDATAEVDRTQTSEELANALRDLGLAKDESVFALLDGLGISLADLAADFGLDINGLDGVLTDELQSLSGALGDKLLTLAQDNSIVALTDSMGIDLTALAADFGIDIAALDTSNSHVIQQLGAGFDNSLGYLGVDITATEQAVAEALGDKLLELARDDSIATLIDSMGIDLVDLASNFDVDIAGLELTMALEFQRLGLSLGVGLLALAHELGLSDDELPPSFVALVEPANTAPVAAVPDQPDFYSFTAQDWADFDIFDPNNDPGTAEAYFRWLNSVDFANLAYLNNIPAYDSGTAYVQGDQFANIHDGEIIVDRASSDALRKYGINVSTTGDSSAIVSAVKQQIAETSHQTKVQAAANKQLVQELRSVNKRLADVESELQTARLTA